MDLLRVRIGTGTTDKDARNRDDSALLVGITTTMTASGREVAGGGSVSPTNVRDKLDVASTTTTMGFDELLSYFSISIILEE